MNKTNMIISVLAASASAFSPIEVHAAANSTCWQEASVQSVPTQISEKLNQLLDQQARLQAAAAELEARTQTVLAEKEEAEGIWQEAVQDYQNTVSSVSARYEVLDTKKTDLLDQATAYVNTVKAQMQEAQEAFEKAEALARAAQDAYEAAGLAYETAVENLEAAQSQLDTFLAKNPEETYSPETLKELEAEADAAREAMEEAQMIWASCSEAVEATQDAREAAVSRQAGLQEELNFSGQRLDQLTGEISEASAQVAAAQAAYEELLSRAEGMDQDAIIAAYTVWMEAESALTSIQAEYDSAYAYNQELGTQITSLEGELSLLSARKAEQEDAALQAQNAYMEASARTEAAQQALDTASQEYAEASEELREAQAQKEEYERQVAAARETAEQAKSDMDKAYEELQQADSGSAKERYEAALAQYSKGSYGFFESIQDIDQGAGYAMKLLEQAEQLYQEKYAYLSKAQYPTCPEALDPSDPRDPSSLESMKKALELAATGNELRAGEGVDALQISSYLMAAAQVQAGWSDNYWEHSNLLDVAENLAMGYSDPYVGWYDQEKEVWDHIDQSYEDGTHYAYDHSIELYVRVTQDGLQVLRDYTGTLYYPQKDGSYVREDGQKFRLELKNGFWCFVGESATITCGGTITGKVGHYRNLIEDSYRTTGFAVSNTNGSGYYGQLCSQTFHYLDSGMYAGMDYDTYLSLFTDYYNAVKSELSEAEAAWKHSSGTYSSHLQATYEALKAEYEAAREALDTLQKASVDTHQQEEALVQAQKDLQKAQDLYDQRVREESSRKQEVQDALAGVQTVQQALDQAQSDLNSLKAEQETAWNTVQSLEQAVQTAGSTAAEARGAWNEAGGPDLLPYPTLKQTLQDSRNLLETLQTTYSGEEANRAALAEQEKQAARTTALLKAELEDQKSALSQAAGSLQAAQADAAVKSGSLETARNLAASFEEISGQIQSLELQISDLRNSLPDLERQAGENRVLSDDAGRTLSQVNSLLEETRYVSGQIQSIAAGGSLVLKDLSSQELSDLLLAASALQSEFSELQEASAPVLAEKFAQMQTAGLNAQNAGERLNAILKELDDTNGSLALLEAEILAEMNPEEEMNPVVEVPAVTAADVVETAVSSGMPEALSLLAGSAAGLAGLGIRKRKEGKRS